MSRKSVQRFCGKDMRKNKDLKSGPSESERSRRALGRLVGRLRSRRLRPSRREGLTRPTVQRPATRS
ncbi:hypothetical protein ELG97_05275 [Rhizobium leguminosarum]|nr:hypothetical protein ELH04_04365 [Rhizobium leguminosarum]TBE91346.1 hypothetical protein ELG97_05275 [Rhizobium leguminosarum]TBZ70317.1 hypothetical protein E0H64_08705 [Rhizobium leguminosarum bv. viciae]TBZ87727.1 hypothetical protein E0H61_02470 [Rhizobium leguminosarum bv. viciae]TBZ94951.1 hypothetical protein E0H56_12485 [Rhizobium leguminosarum bv. viciae]